MQVKIIIGTVAFMLTMILLGFYSLLEPARLENFTNARLGRQIEKGAEIYKNNCSTCHGKDGRAQDCVNAAGEAISCQGLPLNYAPLICGDRSDRMNARGWAGTKEAFIQNTIAGGRAGGIMIAWSQEYGGPLQENEVVAATKYVLNFENEELCSFIATSFPWPENYADLPTVVVEDVVAGTEPFQPEIFPVELPGDVARGEALYKETYPCTSCHGVPEDASTSGGSGPWHGDYATVVESRLGITADNGYVYETVEDYTYRAILYPGEYLVDGYANAMTVFAEDHTMNSNPQHVADLVAYLLAPR